MEISLNQNMCNKHILLYNHDKDVFNNEEGQELLRMMLLKDIRAGVGCQQ